MGADMVKLRCEDKEEGVSMKEAVLYEKLDDGKVRCNVCTHRCVIRDKARGLCRVRENRDGTLYALNYGKTAARGIDPIEKKPLYEFIPRTLSYSFSTVGCNMRCPWCQNHALAFAEEVRGYDITPETHVKTALAHGCESIAYTYSEPTIFIEYALDTMREAHLHGLKNVFVTNGTMTPEALDLILPYLDAVNVDVKAHDDDTYRRFCGTGIEQVYDTIRRMKAAGVHTEVTTLVIPGVNDSEKALTVIVKDIIDAAGTDVVWHISRFFPAYRMKDKLPTDIKTLEKARDIGREHGIRSIYLGNV